MLLLLFRLPCCQRPGLGSNDSSATTLILQVRPNVDAQALALLLVLFVLGLATLFLQLEQSDLAVYARAPIACP